MGISDKLGKMGIPGFRSGKKWKMLIATIFYGFMLLVILAAISPAPSQTGNNPVPQKPMTTNTPEPIIADTTISQITQTDIPTKTTISQTTTPIQTIQNEPNVLSYSTYTNDLGYYNIVGEVDNNLQSNINFVKIIATFYDSQNTVVGTGFTYTDLEIITPGQKSPFEISSYPQKINPARIKLAVAYEDTGTEPYNGLEILSKSSNIDELGYYKTVGEVKNIGDRKSAFVKVIITYYDTSGKVIGKSFSFTNPQDINSGDTAPFELSTYPEKINPSRYEIVVQGT